MTNELTFTHLNYINNSCPRFLLKWNLGRTFFKIPQGLACCRFLDGFHV